MDTPQVNTQENKTVNVKSVNKRVDDLIKTVDNLVNSVEKVKEILDKQLPTQPEPFRSPDAISSSYKPRGYVPPKYRQICDEILSSEFGLDCIENTDNMDFEIKIVIPERFSSLTAEEKRLGVQDIRSKVISRALGENGVREWCMKVRENLNKFYRSSGVQSPFTSSNIIA